mmetsp:Transcript_654/g.1666  ORF Transcript_654/g.1666 Transcript_654/m.1666 type:complete len:307 (+) Transcript_654:451-1371(+)
MLRQHTRSTSTTIEIPRIVQEVESVKTPRIGTGRETCATHLAAHYRDGLRYKVAPRVGVDPEANHLLDFQKAVDVHLPDKAQQLEDCLALQLPAAVQMHLVPCQSLDSDGIQYHLNLAHVDGEEVDVSNAEASLLCNLACRPLLIGVHRVIRPRVQSDHVVHWLRGFHVPGIVQGHEAPVGHPRADPWACEVSPPADQVDLVDSKLTASSDVLHREGAMTNNCDVLPLELMIVYLVEHRIANVPTEYVLTLVGLHSGKSEVAREHADAGGVELGLLAFLCVGHELAVAQPARLHIFCNQLVALYPQ